MDGFESNEGVILIAATNRPDVLDPALLRPGRFDRRIVVPRPDVKGREGILKVHTRKTPLSPEVDLDAVARGTPGFSGADLENLVNEAALIAARKNKERLENGDFEFAKDKVMMGAERRSMIISEKDKKITAWHEAGHALVAKLTEHNDPVHKVVTEQYSRAKQLLIEHKPALDRVAAALLEWETLDGDEVEVLLRGGTLKKSKPVPPAPKPNEVRRPEVKEKSKILDALGGLTAPGPKPEAGKA